MARPTSSTTVQRPELGALAYEYMLAGSRRGFIGTQVMPFFPVPEKSADYPKIPIEAVLKQPNTERTARGGYSRSDWEFETGTYACKEHGHEGPVDDSEAELYARYFDAEEVETERQTDIILRGHEQRVASALFDTSNAVGNSGVTNEWDDAANATPKADVKTAKQAMRAASGLVPNAVVMSLKVFENVMNTSELRTYLQYTSPHLVLGMEAQMDTLARYFEVDRVLVGGAVYDSANKGQAKSIADLWDDEYISLCRVATQASARNLQDPSFGRTFLWEADSDDPVVVETYRDEPIRSTIVRARHHVDEAIVFTGANYLLTNITA